MKKLLLASVAISGLAFAAPAHADVDLELGGYFKGYGAFVSQDEIANTDVNSFDMLRNSEVYIGGETTLDNGLTVGVHFEFDTDSADNATSHVGESYLYFSGDWGRVNVGEESGAGYLLQVAAPSADSNVDGITQFINPFTNQVAGTVTFTAPNLDYRMVDTGNIDKLTYLSPIMNGLQLGVSYTPDTAKYAAPAGLGTETNVAGVYNDAYEVAVRYEGEFENVGVIAGAGYSVVKEEAGSTATDNQEAWNIGLDLDVSAFGIGMVYMENNNGEAGTGVDAGDTETFVVGVDYTTGPFKLGATYYNAEDKSTNGIEFDRYTAGVVYEYGPGMTFRGSVQVLEQDNVTGTSDTDGTAVLLGTQVNF
ncbi:MAG: porin [Alphaproteobacteria bacterium]|nr:porin [Alphaproteobacteria bacterium]